MIRPQLKPVSLQVVLLGGLHVERHGAAARIPGRRARFLFVYLLLHPDRMHRRADLAQRLWAETDPARARRQLSDTLYRLRRAVGGDWLTADRDTIRIKTAAPVWVDVWQFEALEAAGGDDALRDAVTLYQGDLAPEIAADWILPRRVHLRESFIAALLRLARGAEQSQQLSQARGYYRRLTRVDPLREEAQRGLMRCLAGLDLLAEALAGYQRFRQDLATAVHARPTAETRALALRLQQEWDQRQAAAAAPVIPFVGREEERALLLAHLDRAQQGRGGVVVLLGEAGMGKTRLLQMLQASAEWRGWQAVYSRCEAYALPAPYAPLTTALAAALPPPRTQQLTAMLAPRWRPLLGRILPAMQPRNPRPDAPATAHSLHQLATAVGHLLAALGEIAPHLLILDDVQWADAAFWALLEALQPSLADQPVLIIISGRSDGLGAQTAATELIRRWEGQAVPVVPLSPLSVDEVGRLAAAAAGDPVAGDALQQLMEGSGGNPLLALAIVESGGVQETGRRPELAAIFQRRLNDLSAPAQLALQAAAVLGFRFEYGPWAKLVAQVAAEDMPLLAGELERYRTLVLAGNGYQFAHDTWRAYIYARTPDERRVQLHRRALAVLEARSETDALTLLRHAQGANEPAATSGYAIVAGEEALRALTFEAAVAHFSLALQTADAVDLAGRYRATLGRLQALDGLGDRERQEAASAALLRLARRLDDPRARAEAAYYRADWLWKTGDQEQALARAEQGLALATAAGAGALAATCLTMLARIARNRGDFAQARDRLQQAHDRYRALDHHFGEANTLDKLANLMHEGGEYEPAAAAHRQAATLFDAHGHVRQAIRARSGLALSLRALGQVAEAQRLHEQNVAASERLGDLESQWVEQVILGNIAYELGDFDRAIRWYLAGLEIGRQLQDPYAESLILYNLGDAHRELERFGRAQTHYERALAICRERGYRRGEANVRHGLGVTALAQADFAQAEAHLAPARRLWQELNHPLKLVETHAALALARLGAGDVPQAGQDVNAALADLAESQRTTARWRWVHFAAYRVRQAQERLPEAVDHLSQAASALEELVAKAPAGARPYLLTAVPLHRQIRGALRAHSKHIRVRLVRADVPLGRELTPNDTVEVTWTVAAPTDDRFSRRADRRRHVLQRLLAEAAAQGGLPSDPDLAAALDVSIRTIERDIAALRAQGHAIITRRRSRGG